MSQALITTHIQQLIEDINDFRNQGHWSKLEGYFVEKPFIDDFEITQDLAGHKPVHAMLYSWRKIIRDIYYSAKHHLGKIDVERTGKKMVNAESELHAKYYTTREGTRYVLELEGKYKYIFKKVAGRWKVADMRLEISKKHTSQL